jgi:hypothetical protein
VTPSSCGPLPPAAYLASTDAPHPAAAPGGRCFTRLEADASGPDGVIDEAGFMASTPRQAITTIERNPRLARGSDERFTGDGAMGVRPPAK